MAAKRKTSKKPLEKTSTKLKKGKPIRESKVSKGNMKAAKLIQTASSKKSERTKKKYCTFSRCKAPPATEGYCRLHYITVWKTLQLNKRIKAEKRLNAYVDRLVKKYPKDYLEKLKEGLENEEKFRETIQELGAEHELDSDREETTENEFLEKFARSLKIGD